MTGDLTTEQYIKAKRYYWTKRAGPEHNNYPLDVSIWVLFSRHKPSEDHKYNFYKKCIWPGFTDWSNDLTYDELNKYNKKKWRDLNS